MKKILLLIVSGLLIACMAGSAMAAGNIVFVTTAGGSDSFAESTRITTPIQMGLSDTKTIYAACNAYTSNGNFIGSKTYDVSVTRIDDPTGDVHLSVSPSPTFNLIFSGETWLYQPLVLTMSDAETNENYELTVGTDTYHVSVTTEVTTVPEFPTVALPVAAILGLVFIFGRKKEGL
ncbi:PEF-CTERM sorting domain-containing protein [Methanosarcina mazei]|uniref:PEF-CTERM protein sorting domain-containing protein n=1 Tax=Methanosarcina mazei TaxID=2209 RepID=A0A0F8D9D0_METMZ|nr:PEF-CTERM sorting domain-containing protein [Methanosarcina mazei]KKF99262.1 hypothetical protein DU47_20660 [Methanosarcina mazei]KKH86207.1 hypothetical protein DU80_07335 [Methanosarcina mazei]